MAVAPRGERRHIGWILWAPPASRPGATRQGPLHHRVFALPQGMRHVAADRHIWRRKAGPAAHWPPGEVDTAATRRPAITSAAARRVQLLIGRRASQTPRGQYRSDAVVRAAVSDRHARTRRPALLRRLPGCLDRTAHMWRSVAEVSAAPVLSLPHAGHLCVLFVPDHTVLTRTPLAIRCNTIGRPVQHLGPPSATPWTSQCNTLDRPVATPWAAQCNTIGRPVQHLGPPSATPWTAQCNPLDRPVQHLGPPSATPWTAQCNTLDRPVQRSKLDPSIVHQGRPTHPNALLAPHTHTLHTPTLTHPRSTHPHTHAYMPTYMPHLDKPLLLPTHTPYRRGPRPAMPTPPMSTPSTPAPTCMPFTTLPPGHGCRMD
eukprot:351809-Chlamydomonas_euryale.AAC.6